MRNARRTTVPQITPDHAIPFVGSIDLRVRYAECDPMGVAHHGSYVAWLEEARTEILRSAGISYANMEAHGAFLVIAKLSMVYKQPIFYDDLVTVRAQVVGGGRARIDHAYQISLAESSAAHQGSPRSGVLATGATTLACVDENGRPVPLPEWLTAGAHIEPGTVVRVRD